MRILTAAQMREVDRLTTARFRLPSLLLMEQAAARVVEAIESEYGAVAGKSALIVCGTGNNGGDGAAVARQLQTRGCLVSLLLLGRVEDTKGDARANFESLRQLANDGGWYVFVPVENEGQLAEAAAELFSIRHIDFFVDAIFGTGLSRPVTGIFATVIDILNARAPLDDSPELAFDVPEGIVPVAAPVISIDLPSGLHADRATLIGNTVRADLTVTFTAPKIANILPPACDDNGKLVVAPIGSPVSLIEESGSRWQVVVASQVAAWLQASRRTAYAHKGDAGKVLVVAGSRGKIGAACLSGEAAMRAGAGLVTIATAATAQQAIAARVIAECMTEALAEDEAGRISRDASEAALRLAAARDVVALGPGLGTPDASLVDFVRAQIEQRQRPMVIDADGLNALAQSVDELQGSANAPLILTPHPGEMARLTGRSIEEVNAQRLEIASDFAVAHQVIVVLKGSRTVIAAPDGEVYINPTGNAGMATAGSGDVLTGILAGLLAQKPRDQLAGALAATLAGVYLHGLAGDLAARQKGLRALIASDITAHLGAAFLEVGGEAERGEWQRR